MSEGLSSIERASRGDPVLAVSEPEGDTSLGAGSSSSLCMETVPVLGVEEAIAVGGQSSEAASIIPSSPSTSQQVCASSSANERTKGAIIDDYEYDSNIDPEDIRMFDEGFTRVNVRADGPSRVLEIPSDYDLLEDMVDLVPQFDLLFSIAESRSLRGISDVGLSRGVAEMDLRVSSLLFSSFRAFYLC